MKDSVTDFLENLSEDEMQRVVLLKSSLEDLNLILQEIEDTYEILADDDITETEQKNHKIRLYALEQYMAEINEKVNRAMGSENNNENKKLS